MRITRVNKLLYGSVVFLMCLGSCVDQERPNHGRLQKSWYPQETVSSGEVWIINGEPCEIICTGIQIMGSSSGDIYFVRVFDRNMGKVTLPAIAEYALRRGYYHKAVEKRSASNSAPIRPAIGVEDVRPVSGVGCGGATRGTIAAMQIFHIGNAVSSGGQSNLVLLNGY